MKLRIASYNLHKCRGLYGAHDPERNLRVIHSLAPDIIALQEVDYRMGARPEALPRKLINEMTGLEPAPFNGTGEQSLGWHGQTILLRPDLAKIVQVRRLPLPGAEPRGALAAVLPGLTIVAVHLGLMRSSRRQQLARIARQMSRQRGREIALMGDFNEWHEDRGLEPLAGFNILAPGPSWPAPIPRLRLDRMALSREITIHGSGVHDTELARQASDHLPIWADVCVNNL